MQKKLSRALACILAILMILSTISFMEVSAATVTYRTGANGPASTYKSSKYYTHVTSINLSGDGVTDTLAVALSQLGYYEGISSNQYSGLYNTWDTYTSDKTTEYVYNYGDADSSGYRMAWCASFCSWSLFQARVTDHSTHSQSCRNHIGESEYIWRECSCYQWADQLKRFNKYYARGSYTPKAGDLIFFKMDGGGSAWTNHIGLVRYCDGSTVYTVEGNRHNHVGLYSYSLSDSQICGYGVLPYPKNASALKVDYSGANKTAGQYITNNVTLNVSAAKGGSTSFTVGKYEMFDVIGFDGSYAVIRYKGSTGYATLNANTIQVTATASKSTNVSVYAPSGVSDFYAAGDGTIPTSNHDLNPHIYITGLGEDSNQYKGLENYSTNKNNIMINGRTLEKWESRPGGSGINNVWIYGVGEGNAYLGFELASTNILRLPGQTGCGEILQTIVLKRGLEIPKANDNYWDSGELAAGDANLVSTAGILKENVVLVANSNGSFTVVTSGSSSYDSYGYTFTEKTAQIVKLSADANIRKGPDSTYASIGVGLAGSTYEYLDEIQNTKWLKVDYNGQVGWISNVNAGVVNVPQYVTVTGDVNIRSGPSSSYDILSVGLPGDTYEYLGELSGSFYKISYNGQEAWMSKNYATLSTAPQIMTVTAGNAGWGAMDHTPQAAVTENQVAPTCCEEGSYDEVIYCSVCNEEISRVKKTIPVDEDAHNWGEWTETKKATESEAGEETRICKNDSNHIETREIPAFGVLCNVAYNEEEHFIFAGEDTVYQGHDYSFAIEPAHGYEVRAVVFDMRILEAVDGIYTIENVQGNLDILIIVSPTPAQPEAVTFTVTFVDHEDNMIDEQIVEYGQAAIAPEDQVLEGYTFKGWDSEFDYVTKNITVRPVFVKTPEPITVGKLIVMVVGGSGFEINGRPQGVNYTNTNMAIGTSVTLVAKCTENHTFLGWLNATTGVVASTSETFTFKATGSDSYQAVYHTRIEGVNLVIFKNDKAANGNGQIIDMQYYAAGEKVEYPADTARTGYEFTGWDHTPEQIQAKLEAGQDVVVLPTWRVKEIYLKVSVNNGAITAHGTTDGNGGYLYNQGITVKADEAPIGQKFAYWVDRNGNINSYKPEYSFFLYYDKELTAVYVDEAEEIEYEAIVGISANTTVDDVRIGYSYFWEVPDALGTFVKGGVLVVEQKNYKEETFVAGVKAAGLDPNVTESNPSAAQVKDLEGYTSNKLGSQLGTFWYAKSYVQYIDANGELQTVYSDMIEAAKS